MNKQTKKKNSKKTDKIIWTVLVKLISPFIYLYKIFYPHFTTRKDLYNGNDLCYCGSGLTYMTCCQKQNTLDGNVAIRIIKTFPDKNKRTEKIKIIKNERAFLSSIKEGSVNPLNEKGKFIETGFDSDGHG